MGVVESASRLFDLLGSRDTTFTKYLKPGLSEDEIRPIIEPTGVELPSEAVAFYSRFNLPKGYQYSPDRPKFFGIYWLLSLEDAVEQHLFRRSIDYYEERESSWLPLLQEDANFYFLETAHITGGTCPVTYLSEYEMDPEVRFVSLEAMFDTLYYWAYEGVLEIEDGHIVGEYEGDPVRVAQIAAKINPGVRRWETGT
ncbi:MAG TPA: SMI1/KNR4 family protein [Candidatus Saccharimonadales bacterium]|nr:SMI1/KNR4 family protein [Candidatus Saccharimonadales bacterium]